MSAHYSQEKINQELYDDTGYPDWNKIENTFEHAFNVLSFENLQNKDLENIAFLLARQWDVGIIFPYFREEISQIGMTEKQLLILSEHALNSKEWSFRQQCAASIWKAKKYKLEAINIALAFYKEKDADIRRHALNALFKLDYDKLDYLLNESWTNNDELEMQLCLQI